jgi:uncharacterized protein YifE (UPF0438 family)
MASINVLGKMIPIEFLRGKGAVLDMDEDAIVKKAEAMAQLINAKEKSWSADQRRAFTAMNKIIFFEGTVTDNDGFELDRPGCDQNDAIFYWEANEFTFNPDDDVHANTFFHDCWHVVQFQDSGDFARGEEEMTSREVDALERQIEVGELLGNSEHELKFLRDFKNDQARIVARLREGVAKAGPHPTGFPPKD